MLPALSIYIGQSEITILRFESFGNFEIYRVPFVFMGENYGLDYDENFFMDRVIEMACQDMGVAKKDHTVFVGRYPDPNLDLDYCTYVDFVEAMSSNARHSWILVDKFTIFKDNHYSFEFPVNYSPEVNDPGFQVDTETANFLSNMSIFKSFFPIESSGWSELDNITRKISMGMDMSLDENKPVIFTGSRFSKLNDLHNTGTLLMLDLIQQPGLFSIEIDGKSVLPAISFLEHAVANKSARGSEESGEQNISSLGTVEVNEVVDFIKVGTLLNVPGGAEVLVQGEEGTKQFLDVPDSEFFFVPFDTSDRAVISVKNPELGSFESQIKGGEVGFIVDARRKADGSHLGEKSRIKFARKWEKSISNLVNDFE